MASQLRVGNGVPLLALKQCVVGVILVVQLWCCASAKTEPSAAAPAMDESKGYVAPFQLFDNAYYVGDKWVSAFLLTTQDGLILIDTLEYPYSHWVADNIKKLGFDPADIKVIFLTHGHSDHVGGAGIIQALSNAQVVMLEEDSSLLQQQGKRYGFPLPTINQFPKDGDVIRVGKTAITAYATPGHTHGCMSMTFTVFHHGEPFRAFVVCGNGTNFQGMDLARKYATSVKRIRALAKQHPPVAVNFSSHPHLGQILARQGKAANGDAPNPFVDADGFHEFLSLLELRGQAKLKMERKRG